MIKKEKWAWVNLNGNAEIDARTNSRAIAEWTVKVNTTWCQIGLASKWHFHYWYGAIHWKAKFYKGDEIKVQLNLREKKVSFFRNGEVCCVGYKLEDWQIYKDQKYWLGACVWLNPETTKEDDSLELIDFNVKGRIIIVSY